MSNYNIEESPYHQNLVVGDALGVLLQVKIDKDAEIDFYEKLTLARQALLFRMMLSRGIKKIEDWEEAGATIPFTDTLVEDALRFAEELKQED